MIIAITGHSKGLGAELKKHYELKGHVVIGFSRRNGYDLRDWSKMQNMLGQIKDADMLISCAKPDFVQTTLLYEIYKLWEGKEKTIINIGSVLSTFPTNPPSLFEDPMMDLYRTSKLSLNEACSQLSFKSNLPRIMLVNPGHLYGEPMLDVESVRLTSWVNTITTLIEHANKNNFFIKEITLI